MYKTNYVGTESVWKIILQERQNFSSTPLESLFRLQHWVDRRQIDRRSADRFYFYEYMGAFQGKWRHLRPSGFEHAFQLHQPHWPLFCSPDLPFLPLCSEIDIPIPWNFFFQPCHDCSFPSFRSQSLSEIVSPPSFSLPYIIINLFFFFFFQCISQFLIMYWWMCLSPLDFKSHKGRVLAYLVCPSLWLNPIWSRVWALVCRASLQVSPLLPHHCSQRWAGSLALTPGSSIYPSLVHPLSFSSLN